jgi:hypothetical protein
MVMGKRYRCGGARWRNHQYHDSALMVTQLNFAKNRSVRGA